MLGEVATHTGTPWRPKLLAIERPLRFPPITNAPVVSVIRRRPVHYKMLDGSELLCAHREEGIIRAQRRVVRRPERDCPQLSRRRSEVVSVKNNASRRQIASAGQNSKRPAPRGCASWGRRFQNLRGAVGSPGSSLWTARAPERRNRIWRRPRGIPFQEKHGRRFCRCHYPA